MERRFSPVQVAASAFIGIAAFPIAVIVLNLVQRRQYNALQQPISQLALGAGGWLLAIGFCAMGIGILLLALLMRRTVPGATIAPVLLGVAGVLDFVVAAVHTDPTGVPLTAHGLTHNIVGLGTFVLHIVVMVVAGFSFRTSPDWASFSRATFVWSGCALVALFLMFMLGGLGFFGIRQRIFEAARLSWLLIVAWRALSLGKNSRFRY